MADELLGGLGNVNVKESLIGAGNILQTIVIFLVIGGLITVVVLYIIQLLKFKHKFRIIDKTGNVPRIREDKARIMVDKTDGIEKWKLLKFKKWAQSPPADAIGLTIKGAFSVEAYYTEEGGFEYILNKDRISQNSTDKLSTNQKIFLVSEFKKAELDKPKGLHELVAMVLPYASLGMMMIFIVLIILNYEELSKPQIQLANANAQVTENLKQITQMQQEIILKTQSISGTTPEGTRPG